MSEGNIIERGLAMLETEQQIELERYRAFQEVSNLASISRQSAVEILSCVREFVQLKYEFEIAVRSIQARYEGSLAKLKSSEHTLKTEIAKISERLDKVLDKVLEIDTDRSSQEDLRYRAQLLDLADRFSAQLTLVLVKFVSM